MEICKLGRFSGKKREMVCHTVTIAIVCHGRLECYPLETLGGFEVNLWWFHRFNETISYLLVKWSRLPVSFIGFVFFQINHQRNRLIRAELIEIFRSKRVEKRRKICFFSRNQTSSENWYFISKFLRSRADSGGMGKQLVLWPICEQLLVGWWMVWWRFFIGEETEGSRQIAKTLKS